MSLYRRGEIWWGRWRFKGDAAIAESSGTSDEAAAQEWHVMAGTPLEVLQKLGGWADVKIVMRYAHLAPGFAAQWAGNSMLQKLGTADSKEKGSPLEALINGAADGVRTHDNWNHNPISSNVIGLEGASRRGVPVPKTSVKAKKTA